MCRTSTTHPEEIFILVSKNRIRSDQCDFAHLIKHVPQILLGVDPGGHSITEENEVLDRKHLLHYHTHTQVLPTPLISQQEHVDMRLYMKMDKLTGIASY